MIISEISQLCKYCCSEHCLNKWLPCKELTSDIKKFIINNEINVVPHAGETVYDEVSIKEILFPLKF